MIRRAVSGRLARRGASGEPDAGRDERALPRCCSHAGRDLPGGSRRRKQLAKGIEMTVVNGNVLIEKGEHTGAYPGKVARSARVPR